MWLQTYRTAVTTEWSILDLKRLKCSRPEEKTVPLSIFTSASTTKQLITGRTLQIPFGCAGMWHQRAEVKGRWGNNPTGWQLGITWEEKKWSCYLPCLTAFCACVAPLWDPHPRGPYLSLIIKKAQHFSYSGTWEHTSTFNTTQPSNSLLKTWGAHRVDFIWTCTPSCTPSWYLLWEETAVCRERAPCISPARWTVDPGGCCCITLLSRQTELTAVGL